MSEIVDKAPWPGGCIWTNEAEARLKAYFEDALKEAQEDEAAFKVWRRRCKQADRENETLSEALQLISNFHIQHAPCSSVAKAALLSIEQDRRMEAEGKPLTERARFK
jgi:hypothetical protein